MTEVRAAALNPVLSAGWPDGIVSQVGTSLMVVRTEPVLAPLPHIANAVVEAKVVGLERIDRTRSFEAVGA